MNEIKFHEAANIFPLDEENLDALAADIREHGQKAPIETLGGEVLDGRRRYLACQKAEVEAAFKKVVVADPVAYVISLNLHRRHLTPGQLAMCAAKATALREKETQKAKERQKVRKGNQPGASQENFPDLPQGQSRDQVGKLFGVSGKSVDHATKVIDKAVPEVVQAVEEGRMAVSTAAILSSEPAEAQRAEAARPKRRRDYKSVSKPPAPAEGDGAGPEEGEPVGKSKGKGIRLAHEAINCLQRIPQKDYFRRRAFQMVSDWIKHNG